MTRFSVCLLPLYLALSFHSACGFVLSRASGAFSRRVPIVPTHHHTVLAISIWHQDEKLHNSNNYGLTPSITTVKNMEDFLTFLGEDERLCVVHPYVPC
jgi:hypothetical protein